MSDAPGRHRPVRTAWLVRGVDAFGTSLWRAAFTGLGLIGRRAAACRWCAGGSRVLAVAPHPDDEIIGCGGTLLRHVQHRDAVTVVVVTDGRRSRALPRSQDEMARLRRGEAEAAAGVLSAALIWLGCREGEWQDDELDGRLAGLLEELRPDVVYAPSRIDFHPEHCRVAHGLARVLEATRNAPPIVRVYEVQVPLTALLTNLVVAVDPVMPRLEAAVDCYASQSPIIRGAQRMKRYAAAAYRKGDFAEEFWELPVDDYVRLHQGPAAQPRPGEFRGLRPHAHFDPLSYWWGRRARRRLASTTESWIRA